MHITKHILPLSALEMLFTTLLPTTTGFPPPSDIQLARQGLSNMVRSRTWPQENGVAPHSQPRPPVRLHSWTAGTKSQQNGAVPHGHQKKGHSEVQISDHDNRDRVPPPRPQKRSLPARVKEGLKRLKPALRRSDSREVEEKYANMPPKNGNPTEKMGRWLVSQGLQGATPYKDGPLNEQYLKSRIHFQSKFKNVPGNDEKVRYGRHLHDTENMKWLHLQHEKMKLEKMRNDREIKPEAVMVQRGLVAQTESDLRFIQEQRHEFGNLQFSSKPSREPL